MHILMYVSLGAIAAITLFSMGAVLFGKFSDFTVKVVLSTLSIGFYSLTTAVTFGDGATYVVLGAIGIGLGCLGLLMALNLIWGVGRDDAAWRIAFTLAVVAFSYAHAVTNYRLALLSGPSFATMIASIVVLGIVALFLIDLILRGEWGGEGRMRAMIAMAIADVALTVANPIVANLQS
jgi:hypothetical protein